MFYLHVSILNLHLPSLPWLQLFDFAILLLQSSLEVIIESFVAVKSLLLLPDRLGARKKSKRGRERGREGERE